MVILSKYKKVTSIFILLSILYLLQAALIPISSTILGHYHLSGSQAGLVLLVLVLPYTAISFVGLVSYLRLKFYTDTIRKSRDGHAFSFIAAGALLLALWTPISGIVNMVTLAYAGAHPASGALMLNIRNYTNLLIMLPAFWLVLKGSRELLSVSKYPEVSLPQYAMVLLVGFSAIYTALALHGRFESGTHSSDLPEWVVVVTLIIPRLVTWFFAARAVYNIDLYRRKMKAPIYKQALGHLSAGLIVIVATLSLVRSSQAASSEENRVSLAVLLLMAYVLMAFLAYGYLKIARGAELLQKIEDI